MRKKWLEFLLIVFVGSILPCGAAWGYTSADLELLGSSDAAMMDLAGSYRAQGQSIGVYLDGQPITLSNPVVISEGRTMMPLRAVGDLLQVTVKWEPDGVSKLIQITDGKREILLQPQKRFAIVDGVKKPIDASNGKISSDLLDGSIYLPVAFIAGQLDHKIVWDGQRRAVNISSTNCEPAAITTPIPEPEPVYTGEPIAYTKTSINGRTVRYATVDINNPRVTPVLLNAQNKLLSTQSVGDMAKNAGAAVAINGTYFEAYNGTPVPWGLLINDGRLQHIGNSGCAIAITKDRKIIMDHVTVDFMGYVNGEERFIPWRINHPSTEAEAITVFTNDYQNTVTVPQGGKGIIVTNGAVASIVTADFTLPANSFAVVYHPGVVQLANERFKVGDQASFRYTFKTEYTNSADWDNAWVALGAGPSLVLNQTITADGAAEGFWEAKINTASGTRTFIGKTPDNKLLLGVISNVTIIEEAAICQQLGLIDAMCLDSGGSIALYYQGAYQSGPGRDVNNGLGFVIK